jgi:hypothetical protein
LVKLPAVEVAPVPIAHADEQEPELAVLPTQVTTLTAVGIQADDAAPLAFAADRPQTARCWGI